MRDYRLHLNISNSVFLSRNILNFDAATKEVIEKVAINLVKIKQVKLIESEGIHSLRAAIKSKILWSTRSFKVRNLRLCLHKDIAEQCLPLMKAAAFLNAEDFHDWIYLLKIETDLIACFNCC